METKGIIISQKDYERLTDVEKNFNDKVKECEAGFKKALEDAIKGNLVKILWVKDKWYAEMMGCDLSKDGIVNFVSRENADMQVSVNSKTSYDRNDVLEASAKKVYQETISNQKRAIRNLWWAWGIMIVAWLTMLIAYITK